MAAAFKYYKIRMNIILFLIILILGSFISISRSYYFIFQTQDYDEGLLDRPLTTTTRRLLPLSSSSSYGENNSDTGGHHHHHHSHQAQGKEQKQRQIMTTIHRDNNSKNNNTSSSRTVVNDKNSTVDNRDDIYIDDIHEENEISRPNDTNTAIILIAMGSKVVNDTWLTERCVRSIRMGGQYNGYIIIITDKEGYNKYTETLLGGNTNNNNNNKVIIMETKTEDISPKNENGSNIRYYKKRTHMLYKRYKTLALKYLEYAFEFDNDNNKNNNNSSSSTSSTNKIIEHVLYLDVDNIVARPLSIFFNDYYNSINIQLIEAKKRIITTTTTTTTTTTQQQQQQQSNSENSVNSPSNSSSKNAKLRATANANTNDFSFFSFWKDPHVKHKGGKFSLSNIIRKQSRSSTTEGGHTIQHVPFKINVLFSNLSLSHSLPYYPFYVFLSLKPWFQIPPPRPSFLPASLLIYHFYYFIIQYIYGNQDKLCFLQSIVIDV